MVGCPVSNVGTSSSQYNGTVSISWSRPMCHLRLFTPLFFTFFLFVKQQHLYQRDTIKAVFFYFWHFIVFWGNFLTLIMKQITYIYVYNISIVKISAYFFRSPLRNCIMCNEINKVPKLYFTFNSLFSQNISYNPVKQ